MTRREDIPLLLEHFLLKSTCRYNLPPRRIHSHAIELLVNYNWPGNVRELENAIESCVALSSKEEITSDDLPESIRRQEHRISQIHLDIPDEGISLEEVEKELLLKALEKTARNQSKAARFLNIVRQSVRDGVTMRLALRSLSGVSDED